MSTKLISLDFTWKFEITARLPLDLDFEKSAWAILCKVWLVLNTIYFWFITLGIEIMFVALTGARFSKLHHGPMRSCHFWQVSMASWRKQSIFIVLSMELIYKNSKAIPLFGNENKFLLVWICILESDQYVSNCHVGFVSLLFLSKYLQHTGSAHAPCWNFTLCWRHLASSQPTSFQVNRWREWLSGFQSVYANHLFRDWVSLYIAFVHICSAHLGIIQN